MICEVAQHRARSHRRVAILERYKPDQSRSKKEDGATLHKWMPTESIYESQYRGLLPQPFSARTTFLTASLLVSVVYKVRIHMSNWDLRLTMGSCSALIPREQNLVTALVYSNVTACKQAFRNRDGVHALLCRNDIG